MRWFAVQSVFRHRAHDGDSATYEERVLIYRAETVEQVIDRAMTDNAAYLDGNPEFSQAGQSSVFALNTDADDLDGAEVWSCLHRGPSTPEDFWVQRYQRFEVTE